MYWYCRLATSVIVMFAVAIFISYGLHCFVPVDVVWRGYVEPRLRAAATPPARLVLAEYVLRVLLCLLTCQYLQRRHYLALIYMC